MQHLYPYTQRAASYKSSIDQVIENFLFRTLSRVRPYYPMHRGCNNRNHVPPEGALQGPLATIISTRSLYQYSLSKLWVLLICYTQV